MAPTFKPDQLLVIALGSRETRAQHGVEKAGEWEPLRIREKKAPKESESKKDASVTGDGLPQGANGANPHAATAPATHDEDEVIYEEDPNSDEGAVYPIEAGRVKNWSCLFALIQHIHNTISPPFHTPILISVPPAFSPADHESLTVFVFEKIRPPGFTLADASLAAAYAYARLSCCVIDVGHAKVDVTAVLNDYPCASGRAVSLPDIAGEAMSLKLFDMLQAKGFTYDMCEQLKKSPICEILPPGTTLPSETEVPETTSPAAAASTGINGATTASNAKPAPAQNGLPRGPGPGTEAGEEPAAEDNEGVLDVASIVASGKTNEFLAKKEREKAEKAAAKKSAAAAGADAAAKAKLPNSQRVKAVLHYDAPRQPEDEAAAARIAREVEKVELQAGGTEPIKPADGAAATEQQEPVTLTKKEERRRNRDNAGVVRKEIEVGVERFRATDDGFLDLIAEAVYHAIERGVESQYQAEAWENIIVCGNGARIKGFKEALLITLNNKYIISPSSATMFTSELPSNFSTPVPTGANTPLPQPQPTHHASGVNPLLLAATTAQNPALATPGGGGSSSLHPASAMHTPGAHTPGGQFHAAHHRSGGRSQLPAQIRHARAKDYFPEWKDAGMWEADFLGAQIMANIAFCTDTADEKYYMTRAEYNADGPTPIHVCFMLYAID